MYVSQAAPAIDKEAQELEYARLRKHFEEIDQVELPEMVIKRQ